MRGEDRPDARHVPQLGVSHAHGVGHRADEQRVIEELPQLHQLGRVFADRGTSALDVLVVLAAGRVAAVRAGREDQHAPRSGLSQLGEGVLDHRRPVAVAEVHRKVHPGRRKLLLDRRDRVAVQPVDRRDATEVPVVLGDLEEPFARDAAAPGDVLEERHDVLRAFRSAEGHDQNRVVLARSVELGIVGGGSAADSHKALITLMEADER